MLSCFSHVVMPPRPPHSCFSMETNSALNSPNRPPRTLHKIQQSSRWVQPAQNWLRLFLYFQLMFIRMQIKVLYTYVYIIVYTHTYLCICICALRWDSWWFMMMMMMMIIIAIMMMMAIHALTVDHLPVHRSWVTSTSQLPPPGAMGWNTRTFAGDSGLFTCENDRVTGSPANGRCSIAMIEYQRKSKSIWC